MANFTGQPISQSYQRVLQIDGGIIQNGTGSAVTNATIGSLTGSFSGTINNLSASLGAGSILSNVAIGSLTLNANTTGNNVTLL
jgi:hypothetical protein